MATYKQKIAHNFNTIFKLQEKTKFSAKITNANITTKS